MVGHSSKHHFFKSTLSEVRLTVFRFLINLVWRRPQDPLMESLVAVKSIRVVGRGGLAQDPSEVYESDNFKKARREADIIMGRKGSERS